MPRLNITLDEEIAAKLDEEIAALDIKPNPLDDLWARGAESVNGIAIDLPSKGAAVRKRFQLYRRRQALQDAGITSFDGLMITLEGGRLTIQREPEMKVIDL